MTMIEAMTQDLRDSGLITSMSYWTGGSHERTYLNVRGYDASFRGCKSHQLYWDHSAKALVSSYGKGTTTEVFDVSVAAVVEAFAS